MHIPWLFVSVLLISGAYIYLIQQQLPYPSVGKFMVDLTDEILSSKNILLEGVLSPNALLRGAARLFDGQVEGPETVSFTKDGIMLLLDKNGYMHEATQSREGVWQLEKETFYLGVGRPLGSKLDQNGNLIICDALKGLIMVSMGPGPRRVTLLTSRVSASSSIEPDTPITFANALDIASDGRVYFSDYQGIPPALSPEGWWDTYPSFSMSLLWGNFTARLVRYDPVTRVTEVLATGFWNLDGVALSADESFLAMVETNRERALRYWLRGPKAGTVEELLPALPGFPVGLSAASDGGFWLVLSAPPSPAKKLLRYKVVRAVLARLPLSLRPRGARWGAVIKLSPSGEITSWLLDSDGSHISSLSSAVEHEGRLYCGSFLNSYVAMADISSIIRNL